MLTAPLVAANCSETEFFANLMKESADSGAPAGSGRYKVGRSYQIKGVWYRPRIDYRYDQTGVASWYGPQFHGKLTANGEVFDMNQVSAAHKTLPMPSMVRVTNLRNGKAMNLRINDRGPFAHGRIIDLSKRAAQLLGMEKAGTAPVRVQMLERESRILAAIAQGQAPPGTRLGAPATTQVAMAPKPRPAPSVAVTSKSLPAPNGARSATVPLPNHRIQPTTTPKPQAQRPQPPAQVVDGTVSQVKVPGKTRLFIQAGAFSKYANANRVHTLLGTLGQSKITMTKGGERQLFRVRLGPYENVQMADAALARVIGSGYPEARIVID